MSSLTLRSVHDVLQLILPFDGVAYTDGDKCLFQPSCQLITLDDDPIGSKTIGNLAKTESNEKYASKGHITEIVSDAPFQKISYFLLRRLRELQQLTIQHTFSAFLNRRGERTLAAFIVTVNKGYGPEKIIEAVKKLGI